jgi:hypothetical protein
MDLFASKFKGGNYARDDPWIHKVRSDAVEDGL